MSRSIIFLILLLLLWQCKKDRQDIMTYDHPLPTNEDYSRAGVGDLKLSHKVYVYFSKLIFTKFPTDFWLFDSTANTWIPKADFPGVDRIAIHLVAYDQLIYSGLSKVETTPRLADWYSYDTLQNNWTIKALCPFHLPNSMEGHKQPGSKIEFSCGYALSGDPLCPVVYDVKGNSWSRDHINCDSISISCF